MRRSLAFRLFAILALAFLLSGCTVSSGARKVSLQPSYPPIADNRQNGTGGSDLRLAIAAVVSPRETFKSYDHLVEYLGKRLGRPVKLIQRATYAEINELVRSGEVELALVCTNAYVEGHQSFGMELLAAPVVRGEKVYYSYIIVPADSTAESLQDLRGKVFAFSDPLSFSGRIAPLFSLASMGETPEDFFRRYIFTYSHDNSIKAVATKLVDAAAVDSLVLEATFITRPDFKDKVRVIDRSIGVGTPPFVVPKGLDPELKEKLRDIFLRMHEDPDGKEALNDLMIDRFVDLPDSAYDPIRGMRKALGLD